MKKMKITDMNKILELYREGKISRSSYFRAKKRGWVYINYHAPQTRHEEHKYSADEILHIQNYLFKIAAKFFNAYKKRYYENDRCIILDMTNDALVWVLERKIKVDELKRYTKYLFNHLYLQKPYWAKYLDAPVSRAHKSSVSREISYTNDTIEYKKVKEEV